MSWRYRPRRDSIRSNIASGWSGGDDDSDILEAVERAKGLKVCPRRIWAVSSGLPGGARSLPSLIPAADMYSAPSQKRQHHEHEQCTFDFCEHSQLDFTLVEQLHEDCEKEGNCRKFHFPLQLLDHRVETESATAWRLVLGESGDAPSLIDSEQPYMAVSHVWADGTGAGIWGPGKVNACLYRFFCDLARSFQCEGCWWDTISIPRTDKLRNEALNTMHDNYAQARVTLVHDLYLREWQWVDAETACFAIVMSPWYSRGWTALELAKSRKVHILFKSSNGGSSIKDLDVDILDKVSRHHPTAEAIRTLRGAKIRTLDDLSSILSPRDTSKLRDIPIISGLLAGVDVSGGSSQQEIYQRILRKLGKVAQGHLFHNSAATMAAPGFSWCPTNILDIPRTEMNDQSVWLDLQENGDLVGTWKVYLTDNVEHSDFVWQGTHDLTRASLKSALGAKGRKLQHLLLAANTPGNCTRALLVQPTHWEGKLTDVISCRFVGPVYFHPALGSRKDGSKGQLLKIRITKNDKMQSIGSSKWDFLRKTFGKHKTSMELIPNRAEMAWPTPTVLDDDDYGRQDMKALLFLSSSTEEIREQLFLESSRILKLPLPRPKLPDGMVMYCTHENNTKSMSIEAFFYGHEDLVQKVKDWLEKSLMETGDIAKTEGTVKTRRMMHLSSAENRMIQVDASELSAKGSHLEGEALRLVMENEETEDNGENVENGEQSLAASLVKFLLGNGALDDPKRKVKPDKDQNQTFSGIHLAAKKGLTAIAREIFKHMEPGDLNEQDRDGCTALNVAVQKGHLGMVRLLIGAGAATDVPDKGQNFPLHHAAVNGDVSCVQALLNHAKARCQKESMPPASSRARDKGSEGDGAGCKPLGRSVIEQMHPQFTQEANINAVNSDKRTALQLASREGKSNVLELLLAHGAGTSVSDPSDETALTLAAKYGNVEAVEILLQYQPGKDQPDQDQTDKDRLILWDQDGLDAALLSAIMNVSGGPMEKFKKVISKLVSVGARSGPADVDGMTALHWAIKIRGNGEFIAESLIGFMKQHDEHLEKKSKNEQQSALVMAAYYGRKDIVAALLEKGADITSKDLRDRTALHWAALRLQVDIAKELAGRGNKAILHYKDAHDHTALQLAAQKGNCEITEALLEEGAIASQPDKDGRCALILAAQFGRTEVVRVLLGERSDPMRDDESEKSALGWAAMRGFHEVVHVILTHPETTLKDKATEKALKLATQAELRESLATLLLFSPAAATCTSSVTKELMKLIRDPNHQDGSGQTALMFAIQNGKRLLIQHLLLVLKADPDKSDGEKRTPLIMAVQKNDRRGIDELLRSGADINMQDNRNYTALHYAAEHGHFDIIGRMIEQSKLATNPDLRDIRGRTAIHIALESSATRSYDQMSSFSSDLLWEALYPLLRSRARLDIQDEENQTPLHWAVRLNQLDVVKLLLRFNDDANSLDIPDVGGRTPLLLAAGMGSNEIVHELLLTDQSIDPDKQDKRGRTSLLLAAEGGHESSVMALLQEKVNPNLPDNKSRTALMRAAQNGHDSIVRLLTDKEKEQSKRHRSEDVYLDARDDTGRTALMLAAESGHSQIVKYLQEKDSDSSLLDYERKKAWQRAMDKGHADIVDSLLSTSDATNQDMTAVNEALLVASRRGWTELVGVLLKHQADVTFQQQEGTALHVATMGGHVQVVEKLLRRGIGNVAYDKKKRTALMLATEHGFESIVKLLLSNQEVRGSINDWMGPEALRRAAERDNRSIVHHLLAANINPNGRDSTGRTALTLATVNGNQEVVDKLLKGNANPNSKDSQNMTALHHAAWGGHDGVVRSLLVWKAEIHALDEALHLAAERASTSVVRLLLAERANPNARSKNGQTLLHRAALGGSRDIVKLLRESNAVSDLQDSSNNKPWQVAAEKGFESVVETLLEEEVNVRDALISQRKALIFATQQGYAVVAEALLNKGAELWATDEDGLTPLHWAAKRGDHFMAKLYMKRGGPNMMLDAMDNHQQTPLCLAVQEGWAAVTRVLLSNGADPNIIVQEGQTVLHIATKNNNIEIVEILVNNKADPHVRDNLKQKAWLLAAKAGHHHIARLLLAREVDFNPRSQNIEDLFLKMAAWGFVPMVTLLLERSVNKDVTDRRGSSAILIAAKEKKDDVVNLLLSVGADPCIPDSNLQTPLLWAAKTGNQSIVKILLENITRKNAEADKSVMINQTDSKGRTALLIAVRNKHDEVAKLFLAEDLKDTIDLDLRDTTGKTALHYAAETGSDDILRLLLSKEAVRTVQDTLNRTPLFLAADCNRETAVEILLKTRDNALRIPDCHKRTVLHVVAERGNGKLAGMLLECNDDENYLDCLDGLKRTALSLAVENGHREVVDLLLKKNARQDLASRDMRTPLSLAVANGDKSIVAALLKHTGADVEAVDGNGRTLLQLAVQSGNREVVWLVAEQLNQIQRPGNASKAQLK